MSYFSAETLGGRHIIWRPTNKSVTERHSFGNKHLFSILNADAVIVDHQASVSNIFSEI